MEEALARGWTNLFARLDGPMHIRLIVQPLVALLLGVRAGMRDARAHRPPFLAALRRHEQRRERLRQGWRDIGKVFLLAAAIDAIYQTWVHQGIFLLELLVTATVVALVPYALVRGPARRIAGAWIAVREHARGP